ncbi:hypothetical protein SynA1544_01840 [Synechococcus sp. A15-44]|nr:hypothetical protein SynA1544_01840 [Synechococcus sp. A15-44]
MLPGCIFFGSLKHDHQDVETNEQLDRKWFKHLLPLKELLLVKIR